MVNQKLLEKLVERYERQWIALRGDEVVANDEDVVKVTAKAKEKGATEFTLFKVPSPRESFAP